MLSFFKKKTADNEGEYAEVKEAADIVIPSCADFGVARLIECIINGKV